MLVIKTQLKLFKNPGFFKEIYSLVKVKDTAY